MNSNPTPVFVGNVELHADTNIGHGRHMSLKSVNDAKSNDSNEVGAVGTIIEQTKNVIGGMFQDVKKNVGFGVAFDEETPKPVQSLYVNTKFFNASLLTKKIVMLGELPLDVGFQPEIEEEFPTIPNGRPRIEHNIHQIWINVNSTEERSKEDFLVPDNYAGNMKAFMTHNPTWNYFFWTYHTARRLIADRHPYLLGFFDNSTEAVVKADLTRYVVLYEFGGLYADLDTGSVRPLDIATKKYPCMLILAPFENAVCMSHMPYQICNGEIFCRAKHPFFRQVLQEIGRKVVNPKNALVIGPGFITGQYRIYNNISKTEIPQVDLHQDNTSPYFFKGAIPPTDDDGIYIPNTRYFLDQPHPTLKAGVRNRCVNVTTGKFKNDDLVKRMCAVAEKRGFIRPPGKFTFLTHAYAFSFNKANKAKKKTYIPVRSVIERFITYLDFVDQRIINTRK